MFTKLFKVAFDALVAAGALACVLYWLGIKPQDVSNMSLTTPHWIWLVCGLGLFAISLTQVGYSVYTMLHRKIAGPGAAIQVPQPTPVVPNFPSISALTGQTPQLDPEGVRGWFRQGYYSPVTAEVEQNIRTTANIIQPADHEGFYARFIGVGLVAYIHDMTWNAIFKSQLLLLAEMLRRRAHIPVNEARRYYESGFNENPELYRNVDGSQYSFEQWLAYMQGQQLLLRHPSEMLEATHRGADLMAYLAHWGRDINAKKG